MFQPLCLPAAGESIEPCDPYSCFTWYTVKDTDTCDGIALFGGVTTFNLIGANEVIQDAGCDNVSSLAGTVRSVLLSICAEHSSYLQSVRIPDALQN
jgi:hypothetical protein